MSDAIDIKGATVYFSQFARRFFAGDYAADYIQECLLLLYQSPQMPMYEIACTAKKTLWGAIEDRLELPYYGGHFEPVAFSELIDALDRRKPGELEKPRPVVINGNITKMSFGELITMTGYSLSRLRELRLAKRTFFAAVKIQLV